MNEEIKEAAEKRDKSIREAEKSFKRTKFECNVKVAAAEDRVRRIQERIKRLNNAAKSGNKKN